MISCIVKLSKRGFFQEKWTKYYSESSKLLGLQDPALNAKQLDEVNRTVVVQVLCDFCHSFANEKLINAIKTRLKSMFNKEMFQSLLSVASGGVPSIEKVVNDYDSFVNAYVDGMQAFQQGNGGKLKSVDTQMSQKLQVMWNKAKFDLEVVQPQLKEYVETSVKLKYKKKQKRENDAKPENGQLYFVHDFIKSVEKELEDKGVTLQGSLMEMTENHQLSFQTRFNKKDLIKPVFVSRLDNPSTSVNSSSRVDEGLGGIKKEPASDISGSLVN